jgi:hypothetical protein
MATERYNIVFKGDIRAGYNREDVKNSLAAMFKLSVDQIERIFAEAPYFVKKDVDQPTAAQYQAAFERAGAHCQIVPLTQGVAPTSALSEEAPPKSSTMICPKCGFEQDRAAECIRCGIVIQQYLKSQPESATTASPGEGGMICLKCGHEQEEAMRCSKCGVFVKTYLKKQEREAQHTEDAAGYDYEPATRLKKYKPVSDVGGGSFFSRLAARAVGGLIFLAIAGLFGYCSTREEVVKSPDGSLRVTKPRGWTVDRELHDDAGITISNEAKEAYFIVISEYKTDFERTMTYTGHSVLTREFMRDGLFDYAEYSGPTSVEINHMQGVQYEITGSVDGLSIVYLHTTLESHTYFHQLIAWSLPSMYPGNKRVFEEILESFYEL